MADYRTLQEFYTKLRMTGVRLQHQFQLAIDAAPVAGLEDITLWAQGAALPGRTINTGEISYLGFPFNVPTNSIMVNDLSLTINADANLKTHEAFNTWTNLIGNLDIRNGGSGEGDKKLSGVIGRLDLLDDTFTKIITTYELIGLYPTIMGNVELSNTAADIATFTVDLKFQYWRRADSTSGIVDSVLRVASAVGAASTI